MASSNISFSKYHGLGNHVVIVDNRQGLHDFSDQQLNRDICCTKTGVGADCILEVINCRHGNHKSCAFQYVTHLTTGELGGFCGNGSRCLVEFARKIGVVPPEGTFSFCGPDGAHWGRHLVEKGLVEISIRDVSEIKKHNDQSYSIFTRTLCHVEFVEDVKEFDLQNFGEKIEADAKLYPTGLDNIMIAKEREGEVTMRSYESGVKGETWACGTGATAVALVTDFRSNAFNENCRGFTKAINARCVSHFKHLRPARIAQLVERRLRDQ
ncbi:diaminopimelate epimerase-like [Liolophura sinensis]|uniref:diaminopimelate epimerase-like n=1 Tax=Liolophura sinensis TaxID=3198878 RepID=UPI00315930B4